jgi:tetratricopeptide (TPR) repeat protein
MILDELWRLEGPDPRLLLAAARGHAILLLALTPDRMQYSDIFASHALSYLALAKWVDPTLPFTREEAFLAMNMGYTAHADRLLQEGGPGEAELADRIFDDYMRQDLAALKNHLGDGSRVLSYYLLARLYREMGLFREAEQMTEGLYKRFPNLYPAMTEIIFSANLSAAKEMTIYYPLDILARMEHEISPKSLQDEKTWQKRAKIIAGEQSEGSISFSHFEKLMSGWRPFKTNGSPHIFIDEAKVKTIFRSLYTDAIYLRFNVLLNRWSVLEKASNYVESLATEDKDHPLILTMMAEVKVESGNRAEAESICTKVINHPQSSAVLTTIAHYYVQDILTSIKLAPAVAAKMDGRPESLFNMGFVFERLYNYDLAQKYHTLGLKLNPYNYGMYKNLARVSGSHESLSLALERSPHSFKLMEVAAEYFAGKREKEFKLKALEFYDKALDLVPTHKTLSLEKASVLSDLGRHGEAIRVLNDWIDRNGRRDLVTTFYKSSIASNYLKMGNPRLALKVLTKDVDTYQAGVMMNLARVYEALAEPDRAEEIYRKAVQRYPNADHVLSGMAGFMWRNDRDLEAAEYIAKGRKIEGLFSRWYFEDYMEVFAQSQKDRIIKSVDSLMAQGTPSAEIQRLAFTFEKESRPDIAFQLLRKSAPRGTMEQLESNVHIYEVLEKWKGDQEAIKYLQQTVPAQLRAPLVMVLFKRGLFDLILIETQNPAAYPPRYREFMWLQRLLAWLALDKKPAALEEEFAKHYEKSSSDYYHSIGRFMCGKISQGDLLKLIKTPKQRCEFAYYIGLCERLKNNFPEASNWYHLCRETLLSNNGEFHWASAELFWWAHMGTKNRHRLLRHDMEAYHKAHPAKYQTG